MLRQELRWLLQAHRGTIAPAEPGAGTGRRCSTHYGGRGALFHGETPVAITNLLPARSRKGLWDGVARGLITADGSAESARSWTRPPASRAVSDRIPSPESRSRRGTWTPRRRGQVDAAATRAIEEVEELAETLAWQLLRRWGVVFRDVYIKERPVIPWREVLRALRRLEARGLIRGGHFVTGVTGEQFAEENDASIVATAPTRSGTRAQSFAVSPPSFPATNSS